FRVTLLIVPALITALLVSQVAPLQLHNPSALTAKNANVPFKAITGAQPTLVVLVDFSDKGNTTSPTRIANTLSSMNNYYAEDSYGIVSFATTLSPPSSSAWYSLQQTMEYYSSNTAPIDNQLVTDSLEAAYKAGVNFHDCKFAIIVHAGNDQAMPPQASTDIHSFTIPGYVFNPTPLESFQISTSVVSESDPVGVYAHEAGHLQGLPDLYDLTQQIDPANNFVGYWEIMALGEWNPNVATLPPQPSPGTYPSHHSSWSKIKLGWISNSSIRTVYPGNLTTISLQNLELPTSGIQAVKIPISVNSDGSLSYYLIEMRAKLGTYDQYLPFPSDYPGAGLLIYKVNESIAGGHGNLRLIDAHPGGDLSDAPFGPCSSPCVSNNTFSDTSYFVKIIVTTTNATAYTIIVDRTSSPLLLLQVNTPAAGVLISVDGTNLTSDRSNELRLPVHYGPHEVYIQSQVPLSLGSTTIQVGLTNSFAAWNDGSTANPRWVSVITDTIITATYRVTVEPSFATVATAMILLGVVVAGITLNRRRSRNRAQARPKAGPLGSPSLPTVSASSESLPRDNGLGKDAVKSDQEPNQAHP
ncbi:MAG TPA: M6 family metalloprotease domain-containing protein, partial [Candidatus Angelobacter sp.]|nr:M6 family metalloprotease domain-containing protein [Candidatus Angelobacter sp.]